MPILAFCTLLTLLAPSPEPPEPPEPPAAPAFRTTSDLVLVPATVTDRRGALIPGLPATAFSLRQDGKPRQIVSFGQQDLPASIGIVLDISASMRDALPHAKAMLRAFFDTCNPDDEAFLYTVSSRPDTSSAFTSDFGALLSHSVFFTAQGNTALTDALFAATRATRSATRPRKAILVISDGVDNHSRYSKPELLAALLEADVQVYSIAVFEPDRHRKAIALLEDREGLAFLDTLARRTGGLHIVVRDKQDILRAAAEIGRAIREQYLLGFLPDANVPAKSDPWHSIEVAVNVPATTVYARSRFKAREPASTR